MHADLFSGIRNVVREAQGPIEVDTSAEEERDVCAWDTGEARAREALTRAECREPWELEKERLSKKMAYAMRRSEFVEIAYMVPSGIPGRNDLVPFSYKDRPYLLPIYNCMRKRVLLMAGRQVEKSSTLAFWILTCCAMIPGYKVLYVTPSALQTKEFSRAKLNEVLDSSPVIRTWFPRTLVDSVFEKAAINRSGIKLRYAFLSADRCRGITADDIHLDEFQDLHIDNIPVIEQAASHSSHDYRRFAGTPKSRDNPMEVYWSKRSTQNEWLVPCEAHGLPKNPGTWHWNILSEKNIGRRGLICDKPGCGRLINAANPAAHWYRTGPKDAEFEGFRIPQLMTPWMRHPDKWAQIFNNYTNGGMARAKFWNEVLGLAFDDGQRPLNADDIQRCCDPDWSMQQAQELTTRIKALHAPIYMGIDWGQDSTKSYTVVVLGCWDKGRFRVILAERLTGANESRMAQLHLIKQVVDLHRVARIGVDYGGGLDPNAELERVYGTKRVCKFQWCAPATYLDFNPNTRTWMAHRTEVMAALFRAAKEGRFVYPRWSEWRTPYGDDMVSNYSEYSERTHLTTFKKSVNATDDTLHALFYCFLASLMDNPRPDIFMPSMRVDQSIVNSADNARWNPDVSSW